MSTSNMKAPPDQGVSPLNFIYACSICCASFADVYEGHEESVQGLSDGINPKERLVTKLYLANCCHVFCSKHLDGGAPAFHPAEQRPKAACPVCIKEKNDSGVRDLYSVRGFKKDEYDPQIPPTWFTAPPIQMDGSGKEMEALRFQYIALIRYCQNTYAARKPLQEACSAAERKLASMQDLVSDEHTKVLNLQHENKQLHVKLEQFEAMQAKIERLKKFEQDFEQYRRLNVNPRDLETFVTNKAAIRHYLKLFPILIDQNTKMQKRLASLGFAMALEPMPRLQGVDPKTFDGDKIFDREDAGEDAGEEDLPIHTTASSQTIGRPMSGRAPNDSPSSFTQRPMKRQRLESSHPRDILINSVTSRDAMPPPPKPVSRLHSVRKIIPTLRKRLSYSHRMPPIERTTQQDGDVYMDSAGHDYTVEDGFSAPNNSLDMDIPYMTGALPVEESLRSSNPRRSNLLTNMGISDGRSDFTFRTSSPVRSEAPRSDGQSGQLPTEPSYLRFMDGLTSETEPELRLKDPRSSRIWRDHDHNGNQQQATRPFQQQHHLQEVGGQKLWNLGLPTADKSSRGPLAAIRDRSDPPYFTTTNAGFRRMTTEVGLEPATPGPRGNQRSRQVTEDIVSPFFDSGHGYTPAYNTTRSAELQNSSNRSGASQSRSWRDEDSRTVWREYRGPNVNGLSFFETPVNSRNEPIQSSRGRFVDGPMSLSRQYRNSRLQTGGFVTRQGLSQTSHDRDSVYGSTPVKQPPEKQSFLQYRSTFPIPDCRGSQTSCAGNLPWQISSKTPRRIQARTRPQWESLQRAGVRSSRHTLTNGNGNLSMGSARQIFSSNGQRSVRR